MQIKQKCREKSLADIEVMHIEQSCKREVNQMHGRYKEKLDVLEKLKNISTLQLSSAYYGLVQGN